MSAAYRHCVNGLLTSIVWTLTGRLYDVYITDIVYLLDVLVVIVYMSYCNCWVYLLLHEDSGECSEDWAGACRWGGGGGEVEYWTENFFPLRNVPGVLKRQTKKKILERLGGQKLSSGNLGGGRRKKNKNKKFWQTHKAFPAGSRECLISQEILK